MSDEDRRKCMKGKNAVLTWSLCIFILTTNVNANILVFAFDDNNLLIVLTSSLMKVFLFGTE